MKRKTVAAIVIAVLLVFSIVLFRAYRKGPTTASNNTSISLLGEWELDSAYAANDKNKMTAALNVPSVKTTIHFNFKADSSLEQITGVDSFKLRYYQQDSTLFIDKGAGYTAHLLQRLSDSLVSFTTTDSLVFVLRRH